MKLCLLYGTVTGNAEMLCEDIETELGEGYQTEIKDMGEVTPADLDPAVFYMFITSTHGNGDVPETAAAFTESLEQEKPDLGAIHFAIFGLGDMVFSETFAHGSKIVMELMQGCGATMVGERGIHDASSADLPEDIAVPWARDILSQLQAKAA
jgi:MioC protein